MKWPLHGSNPQYIYETLQLAMPKQVIDFSVNLNPFGPPSSLKKNWLDWFEHIEDYPDPQGSELKELIAKKENVSVDSILLGNGGAELITLLASFLAKKRVLLIQPTFAEYGKMCQAYRCDISHLHLQEGEWHIRSKREYLIEQIRQVDALFLCHPNNPTGVAYSTSTLTAIMEACEQHECFMIIDEAFYDFLDDKRTLAPFIKNNPNLIVIRSLTKMYAIAGLRLGFLLADPKVIHNMSKLQPHWSVNALALAAGKVCMQEEEYVDDARQFVQKERNRLMKLLREAGFYISNSEVNFYLLKDPTLDDQFPLFIYLLKKGIVPRHTVNYRGLEGRWLRFGVKQTAKNDLLLEALLAWKNDNSNL